MKALVSLALLLLVALPAEAAWWKTQTVYRCVQMTEVQVASPKVPESSAATISACIRTANGKLVDATAYISYLSEEGGYIEQFVTVPLAVTQFTFNPTFTRAVLRLAPESIITWISQGDGEDTIDDLVTHKVGVATHTRRESTDRWATATGTLDGVAFGPEQNTAHFPQQTSIMKMVIYE